MCFLIFFFTFYYFPLRIGYGVCDALTYFCLFLLKEATFWTSLSNQNSNTFLNKNNEADTNQEYEPCKTKKGCFKKDETAFTSQSNIIFKL